MSRLLLPEDETLIETSEILYAQGLTEPQRANRREDVQTVVVMQRGEAHLTIAFDDFAERSSRLRPEPWGRVGRKTPQDIGSVRLV